MINGEGAVIKGVIIGVVIVWHANDGRDKKVGVGTIDTVGAIDGLGVIDVGVII